jgi:hypothetical protein
MANFPKATEVVVRGCSLSDESFIRIAGACPKTTYLSRAVLPCRALPLSLTFSRSLRLSGVDGE